MSLCLLGISSQSDVSEGEIKEHVLPFPALDGFLLTGGKRTKLYGRSLRLLCSLLLPQHPEQSLAQQVLSKCQ